MTRYRLVWLASIVPGMLAAQTPGALSAPCVPALGWNVKDCSNCVITGDDEVQFLVEPRLRGVDASAAGPARGALHDGDVLVAVDDQLITTQAAWGAIHSAQTNGGRLSLTVRRGGEQVTVPIQVGAHCSVQVDAVNPARGKQFSSRTFDSAALTPSAPYTLRADASALDSARFFARARDSAVARTPSLSTPRAPAGPSTQTPLGLGITCDRMSAITSSTDGAAVFSFAQPPVVSYIVPDGPADKAGVLIGDTIVSVNNTAITTDYGGRLFSVVAPGEQLTLRLQHGPRTRNVAIRAALPAALRAPNGPASAVRAAQSGAKPSQATGTGAPSNASAPMTQEFYVGGVRIAIDGGFKRMEFDPKTQEMKFTFPDGHVVRVKAMP
ncbi:MAG TPA: PDZ domain-containing protein [Gemmatimonadaceae bacterium]|nr:PDZ domain-containing protein [Gemmatimonadaceae bacterium]